MPRRGVGRGSAPWLALALGLLSPLSTSSTARAQGGTPIGHGFQLQTVAEGLDAAVAFDFAPDGSLFIAQKNGVVRVQREGVLLPEPFVDVSAEVNHISDRGLLGIAVHPEFPARPYVYLLYTYDPPQTAGQSGLAGPDRGGARVARLSRFEADPASGHERALSASGVVLVGAQSTWANIGNPQGRNDYTPPSCGAPGAYARDCIPADELSHTIGALQFGPDGMLYAASGDGCDYIRAQNACTRSLDVDSLAGKILRIDPMSGDGPSDNPFFDGDPRSNRSRVYQLGLRNPFRFRFDTASGELYVGDVGWNTWEEVNRGGPGANFGWPCYEGGSGVLLEQPQYRNMARCAELRDSGGSVRPSLYAYTHASTSSSVQVGDVYRGDSYPEEFHGALFYTDYNKQELRYLTFDAGGGVLASHTLAGGLDGMVQVSAHPTEADLYIARITSPQGSVIERLHYDPPEPGAVADGSYELQAHGNLACVEAIPETRFWFWVTSPARVETQGCGGGESHAWELLDTGDGSYRITSQSLSSVLGVSGGTAVPQGWSGAAAQRWRPTPVSSGYRLVNEASGQCLATTSSAAVSNLAAVACADVPAQRFSLLRAGNSAPVIVPLADQTGNVGDDVALNVSASDADGDPLSFSAAGLPAGLAINDQTGAVVGQLTAQGEHDVVVTVSDGYEQASSAFHFRVIDDRVPVVSMLAPVEGQLYQPGDVIEFAAEAVDWQGVLLPAASLAWELYSHHNQHIHFDGIPPTSGPSGSFVADDHGDNTWLELCVTAADGFEREATECRSLHPREVDYTIDSQPRGLSLPWEGVARTTPFTVRTHAGGVRDLSAPLMQAGYAFVAWSDGGAASHSIVVGSEPRTLVAHYERVAPSPGVYRLQAVHSDKCVEHRPASYFLWWQTAPERFAQYPCQSIAAQRFDLVDNSDGTFRLTNDSDALTVSSGSSSAGASIVPASYSGAASQRWTVAPASSGYSLRNAGSGLCLSVSNASTSDNAAYVQAACSDLPSQRFELMP